MYGQAIHATTIANSGLQNLWRKCPMPLNSLLSQEYPLGSIRLSGLFIT